MRKKRIMLVGESSFLSTGFSTYSLELLRRLNDSSKYELMEYASYSPWNDVRARQLPWPHKTAMYNPDAPGERERYHSHPLNQFGEWKFEEACLEFRPDIVASFRDPWMDVFLVTSPFRRNYHYVYMPTVDAEPQREDWLAQFADADALFTYSDWGADLLRKQGLRVLGSAPPGADLETYHIKPDRRAHKDSMGLDPDTLIVGTVMRNQVRKLYPEFLEAFARFLREAPQELARKTYLYLHTAWPDLGWDIPLLLKETGLSSKALFTYMCMNCGKAYPSFFQDTKAVCKHCGQPSATFPKTQLGVSRKVLCETFSLFDVYVQYANSEGFGMPMVEAAACGLPVMATDYSAMSDVVRKVKGIPIRPLCLIREPQTHCKRAIPDAADFVEKLTRFLLLPEPVRARKGREARLAVEQHYTWDKTAKQWMDHFDSIEVRPHQHTWLSPLKLHEPNPGVPDGLSNEEFIRWGMTHIAGRPDLVNSYTALRMISDLNWGATLGQGISGMYFNEDSALGSQQKPQEFNRERALALMVDICEKRNQWETLRGRLEE